MSDFSRRILIIGGTTVFAVAALMSAYHIATAGWMTEKELRGVGQPYGVSPAFIGIVVVAALIGAGMIMLGRGAKHRRPTMRHAHRA